MEGLWRGIIWLTIEVAVVVVVCGVEGEAQVPALFMFGDSLLDTGNNNGLNTIARAASPPYGTDFQSNGSSGRFSNGAITTDIIAASMNLPCPPPYVSAGDNIEHGVNFASAGSGILQSTGIGEHYSMADQISKFGDVKKRLEEKVGRERSGEIISKAVFYITAGSNDYLVTYYAVPPTSPYALYSPSSFRDILIANLSINLQGLYDMGARKFAVTSIPNIGCTPYALRMYGMGDMDELNCVKFMNDAAKAYNSLFFRLIRRLQAQHPDAHFVSNNAYEAALLPYQNAIAYGIVDVRDACCHFGELVQGLCVRGFQMCSNASQYFFFDGFHPTSTVHKITALCYVTGNSRFVYPFNLQKLASLP